MFDLIQIANLIGHL